MPGRVLDLVNLRPKGSAADLPFGTGPIDFGGGAGAAGPKTLIFDIWALGGPLGAQECQNRMF